jgi:hypothetical protein
MKFPVQIDFQILDSSVDPKEISEIIGVQPDTALRKGERNRSLGLPKWNIWAKRSVAQTPDAFLEDHWAALAPPLSEARKQFSGKPRAAAISG